MIDAFLSGYVEDLLAIALDPRTRLFLGYLALALLIALVWLRLRQGLGLRDAVRRLAARDVWCSESARADYKLLLVNQALMLGFAPALLAQMSVAAFAFYALHDVAWLSPEMGAGLPGWMVTASFTLVLFVVDDFSRYLVHRMMHRVPLLWSFHKVHHSARTLTPVTVYRTHPVENALFAVRSALVQGSVIALFVFGFGDGVDLVTVLGVNVLVFAFNAAGSNLRHSHVALGYGSAVERVLMSPAQHQIHHSVDPRHHDRNFGAALSLWDWCAGSLCPSRRGERLEFGLSARPVPGEQSLSRLYLAPFAEAAALVGSRCARVLAPLASAWRARGAESMSLSRRRV